MAREVHHSLPHVEARQEGHVTVGSIIRTDGLMADMSALQGVSPTIDAEAVHVVRAMTRWKTRKIERTRCGCALRATDHLPPQETGIPGCTGQAAAGGSMRFMMPPCPARHRSLNGPREVPP